MQDREHIVLLVHGIRTFGAWQERLAELLREREPGVRVLHFRYGYFSAIAFLVPFIRIWVLRRLRRYLASQAESWRGARVDIVAHSFGTCLTGWALRGLAPSQRPAIHTVLLCGSVLRPSFPWQELVGPDRCIRRIVNDCGSKDWWPVVSEIVVWRTGISGRTGFTGVVGTDAGIVNRYFPVDHGGFFEPDFMVRNWLPVLCSEAIPADKEAAVPPARLWAVAAIENYLEGWKLVLWLIIILTPFIYGYSAATANARETALKQSAEASALLFRDPYLATVKALQSLDALDRWWWTAEPGIVETVSAIRDRAWETAQTRYAVFLNAEKRWQTAPGLGLELNVSFSELLPMQASQDGRYLLVPIEQKIGSGGIAPFDLYLWDNIALTTERLEAPTDEPHAGDFPINFYSLDEANDRIIVARRFYLTFYDLEGRPYETIDTSERGSSNCYPTKYEIVFAASYAGGAGLVLSDVPGALWTYNLPARCGADPAAEIMTERPPLKSVEINASQDLGLVIHHDGAAALWRIKDLAAPFREIGKDVSTAAFRPSVNEEFMTLGRDGSVTLWANNGGTPRAIRKITQPDQTIIYANFTGGGDQLTTLTADGVPAIWDVATGRQTWTVEPLTKLPAIALAPGP